MSDVYTVFRSLSDNLTSSEIRELLKILRDTNSANLLYDLLVEEVGYDPELEVAG